MARLPVVWLESALDDFDRLHSFLYEQSPQAAQKAAATIYKGTLPLEETPMAGRPTEIIGQRELFMVFGSGAYVIRYRLAKESIVILRVWHGRENRYEPHN